MNSILSQQISSKALETVWQRITRLLPEPTPEAVLSCDSAALRACGISGRKEGCIRRLAGCAASGELDLDALGGLSDARVKEALTGLSGIGEWTAEMFLLFSLQRRDILAKSDFGIQKGLMRLHALPQITEEVYMRYRRLYSPCGSVASLYLWEIAKLK